MMEVVMIRRETAIQLVVLSCWGSHLNLLQLPLRRLRHISVLKLALFITVNLVTTLPEEMSFWQ